MRSVVGLVLVALLAAGCLSKPQLFPSSTPTPTAAPSRADAASGAAGPSPGLPTSESGLAALLPDKISGQRAFKLAMGGEQLIGGGAVVNIEPEFQGVLDTLDAQPDDVSFALSSVENVDGAAVVIMAFRIADANTSQLQSAFQTFWSPPSQPVDWQPASVGGKSVVAGSDADNPGNTISVYAVGDLIFYVSAPNEELATELLSPLP